MPTQAHQFCLCILGTSASLKVSFHMGSLGPPEWFEGSLMCLTTVLQTSSSSWHTVHEIPCRFMMKSRQNLYTFRQLFTVGLFLYAAWRTRCTFTLYILQCQQAVLMFFTVIYSWTSVSSNFTALMIWYCPEWLGTIAAVSFGEIQVNSSFFTALYSDRSCSADQVYVARHPYVSFSCLLWSLISPYLYCFLDVLSPTPHYCQPPQSAGSTLNSVQTCKQWQACLFDPDLPCYIMLISVLCPFLPTPYPHLSSKLFYKIQCYPQTLLKICCILALPTVQV